MSAKLRAGLNADGLPVSWLHRIVGPDHMGQGLAELMPSMLPYSVPRGVRNIATLVAEAALPLVVPGKKAAEGAGPPCYDIENLAVEYVGDDPGVRIGFWRSVAFSQNIFFVESFMDEIAAVANRDPLELRLALTQGAPRLQGVLKLAAAQANWTQTLDGKRHLGIAAYEFHGTMLAAIAEVSMQARGRFRVLRVICAVDCGMVINPGIVASQIAGGLAFGLTAAMKSQITVTDGRVDQSNFDDFPLLRMNEMPQVEVHIVPSTDAPTGIGECAVPVIAPALTNALFAATGRRIRRLPVRPEDLPW